MLTAQAKSALFGLMVKTVASVKPTIKVYLTENEDMSPEEAEQHLQQLLEE